MLEALSNLLKEDFTGLPRVSKIELGLLSAKLASLRSEDVFFTRVGCAAENYEGEIIGISYAGLLPKQEMPESFWKNRELKNKFILHSEINILKRFERNRIKTLYLTHSPCKVCAMFIVSHGVKEIFYLEEYHRCSEFKEIFDFYGIKHQCWKGAD